MLARATLGRGNIVRRRWQNAKHLFAALVTAALCLALSPAVAGASATGGGTGAPGTTVSLAGNGSVDEAWLTGGSPGDQVTLVRDGSVVAVSGNPGHADPLGSLIIRDLTPGPGYSWMDTTTGQTTNSFQVLAPGQNPAPNSALYTDQPMQQGLNYVTMRDGVSLAATVRFPYGETCSAADPCPTVIEYSGYATAGPTDPIPSYIAQALGTTCAGCGDPDLLPDSATAVGSVVARTVGFATVSVQMRGTGCSGGAFDLFGYPSDYDAYDAIEIVANQSWVAHHKVGMVGISYSGLSELPAAGTDPPDLAAIAPMSPTDDLFSTGYPGGIYNDGFAASWVSARIDDAMPTASYDNGHLVPLGTTPVTNVGQPWTYYEIDAELADSGLNLFHLSRESSPPRPGRGTRKSGRAADRCPRKRIGPRPVSLRPTFHGGLGRLHQGSRLSLGRSPGRADGPAMACAHRRHPEDDSPVRQHGQRRPHRFRRSTNPLPLAGVPRPLCGR